MRTIINPEHAEFTADKLQRFSELAYEDQTKNKCKKEKLG
jgi:hypothetical protein